MSQEYRLSDVLLALAAEDPVKLLSEDPDKLSAMLVYCKRDSHVLAARIMDESKTTREQRQAYIKGLIALYPISSEVIEKVILDEPLSEYVDVFDNSEIMKRCFTKFCGVLSHGSQSSVADTKMLAQSIARYDECIASYKGQIQAVREQKQAETAKHDEAVKLESELKALKAEWSHDAIAQRIQKAQAEIARVQKEKEEPEKQLKALQKQLEEIKGRTGASFEKKLAAFAKVMNETPEDASET